MPVANPAPNYLKPRKLVTDLAALLCKGFSRFSEAGVSTLYEHLQEGSQTPLEIRSGMGFNKGTGPTRWGNQLNGNIESIGASAILATLARLGPTRWGNQLNGNYEGSCHDVSIV